MRAVVQRVARASVTADGSVCGAIECGLLVYLGVSVDDTETDATYLAEKIRHVRMFVDTEGKLNLDVVQAGGGVLVVSAFSVQADARKGRRPSFTAAAGAEHANAIYELFCAALSARDVAVETGSFGSHMAVESVNDGPICILLDSSRLF